MEGSLGTLAQIVAAEPQLKVKLKHAQNSVERLKAELVVLERQELNADLREAAAQVRFLKAPGVTQELGYGREFTTLDSSLDSFSRSIKRAARNPQVKGALHREEAVRELRGALEGTALGRIGMRLEDLSMRAGKVGELALAVAAAAEGPDLENPLGREDVANWLMRGLDGAFAEQMGWSLADLLNDFPLQGAMGEDELGREVFVPATWSPPAGVSWLLPYTVSALSGAERGDRVIAALAMIGVPVAPQLRRRIWEGAEAAAIGVVKLEGIIKAVAEGPRTHATGHRADH